MCSNQVVVSLFPQNQDNSERGILSRCPARCHYYFKNSIFYFKNSIFLTRAIEFVSSR